MSVVLGIVGAVLLIVAIAFISMRLTDRKSNEKLKRHRSDGSFYESDYGPKSGGVD